ncbi:MAG TPA: class I SAM-dependent methyltransferase [Gaiellaceae bacterium]
MLKHRAVTVVAKRAPQLLPLRHLGRFHYSQKFLIADGDEYAGVDYASVYEQYLGPWRRRPFTLLELGVYRGESMRMWRDYFPKARIVGLDIDPEAARRAPGFEVYVGSQADPELLGRVTRDLPTIDVVIDDASHINELTVASFHSLFPHLAPGGLYFIEDVPRGSGEISDVAAVSGMSLNVDVEFVNRREAIDELIAEIARDTEEGARRRTDFIHVYPRIIVVKRAVDPR